MLFRSNVSSGVMSDKISRLIRSSGVLDPIAKDDFTAVKMHFGEDENEGHIKSDWTTEILRHLKAKTKNAFLTDSNVIYKDSLRTNAVDHLILADKHGFNLGSTGVPVIIADGLLGANFKQIPVAKKHFKTVKIATEIGTSDSMLVLTHVTGHMLTGLGGAIKNLGMGCASRRGKYEQHCGIVPAVNAASCVRCGMCVASCPASCISVGTSGVSIASESCLGCGECVVTCRTKALEIKWSESVGKLQEKMVEYAYGVMKAVKGKTGFISFLIKITKDCDCIARDEDRIIDDLGILASTDPVSIDKASVDLMMGASGTDVLKKGYPEANWTIQLNYASKMGLGSLDYKLERL